MHISNDFKKYSLHKSSTISHCLELLEKNGGFPISIIDSNDIFLGIVSNSSVRSAYEKRLDKENPCTKIIIRNCITARNEDNFETLSGYFLNAKKDYKLIPLLTSSRKLKGFAINSPPFFQIGNLKISKNCKDLLLIAEIGVNHNGSYEKAKKLVNAAKNSGFNAIKLQFRSPETYSRDSLFDQELSVQYIKSELIKNNLEIDIEKKLIEFIKKTNLLLIITPFDEYSLERALQFKPDALKVASADFNNYPLLEKIANTNLPVIISTGMSYESDLIQLSVWCKKYLKNYAFLHCNSTYPTPIEDVNLSYIERLNLIFDCVIGYSSHDFDYLVPIASICYGAKIIETHITESKNEEGTDHLASIEIKDLNDFVEKVNLIKISKGEFSPRVPTQGELINRIALSKSLCFRRDFKKGKIINKDDLELRSPGDGIPYSRFESILGKSLCINVKKGSQVKKDYFELNKKLASTINEFSGLKDLNWGLPVRFRDILPLNEICNPPILEFHLSSNDLAYNFEKTLKRGSFLEKKYTVHAIEQYSDGFILDLCSKEEFIRKESIKRIKDVVDITLKIKEYFPLMKSKKIPIVLNIGGFTRHGFASKKEKNDYLDNGCESLEKIMKTYQEVEFLPQSMPPFPWFQGGKAFHNVLCSAEDIKSLNSRLGLSITMDISHTALFCNYKQIDILEFMDETIDYYSHVHLSDSNKNGQEGLQLGFGSLPLREIVSKISSSKASPSIVLEIWQGHLDSFKGFKDALEILSTLIN